MKVVVKDNFLNIRMGAPSVNAKCIQYLAPGSEIEVDGKLYPGDLYSNISTWYKDELDNYYWSGGVSSSEAPDEFLRDAVFPPQLINLNALVKLPAAIKETLGRNVKIAVLDRGLDRSHPDISAGIADAADFTNAAAGAMDIIGHGTAMASIIGASAFYKTRGVAGVAPGARLWAAKVLYDENDPQDFLSVKRGLDFVAAQKVDIVNLSLGRDAAVGSVSDAINAMADTVFVASTKQWRDHTPAELMQFPANHEKVIPVAALPADYVRANWNSLPAPLIIIPYGNVWSCSTKDNRYYRQESGSSVAAAVTSGIIALILSANPALARNKNSILSELEKYASSVDDAYKNPGQEICFILKR